MAKYLAIYNLSIQPYEEAPEQERRNYDFFAENDEDAIKKAENKRINLLREELLSGSAVTLERLLKIEDIKI